MKLVENSRGQGCSETQGGGYEVGGGDEEGEESAVDGLTAGPRLGEEGQLPRPPRSTSTFRIYQFVIFLGNFRPEITNTIVQLIDLLKNKCLKEKIHINFQSSYFNQNDVMSER